MSVTFPATTTDFLTDVRGRVDAYLRAQPAGRFADRAMIVKAALHLGTAAGLYALVVSGWLHGWLLTLVAALFNVNQFLIALHVAHDASHQAFSRRPWVNLWLTRAFDLVGVDSYIWDFNHVRSHHRGPNVPLRDSAIDSFAVFKLHPRARAWKYARFQHFYILLIYAVSTLFKLVYLDVFSYARREIGGLPTPRHPRSKIVLTAVSKLAVITYSVVIPSLMVSGSFWYVLAGFLFGHVVAGMLIGFTFQVTHLSDTTVFPEPDADGKLPFDYGEHLLRTTADFAPRSAFVRWISGGLNLHVAHHLFPAVCQSHLPALTRIVAEAAADHGLPYRSYDTVTSAFASHLRLLARIGRGEVDEIPGRAGGRVLVPRGAPAHLEAAPAVQMP